MMWSTIGFRVSNCCRSTPLTIHVTRTCSLLRINNPCTRCYVASPVPTTPSAAATATPTSTAHAPPLTQHHISPPPVDNKYDLVVIGSGPAGQKCAIAAAKQRKKVAIVDRRSMLGGVCIHTGTIPSKTFREAILYLTGYRQRGFYGKGAVRRDAVKSGDIMERVKKVEGWETETILDQLHRNRVVTLEGTARFLDQHHLEITPSVEPVEGVERHVNVVRADHILVATGTRPARNPMYPFDSDLVFDSDSILSSQNWDNTRHLIVVGSGVIAMEYASMFNSLPGCRVTIIDEKPSFLDFVDTEVVQTLRHIMGRRGATFRLGEKVTGVTVENGRVRVTCDSGKICVGDALFYAVGRQGNSNALNLEAAGITPNKRGLISVNEYFQTDVPHIYAAGDIIGFPALASTAMEQGRLCAQHMFGHATPMRPVFPYGIYTIPEISVIGKSEQELTRDKIPYEIGIAKFEETAKGQMIGGQHMDGFLKLLFCPYTKKLLGCHCIGESAVEIIHIGQVVISMGGTIEYFRDSVFNYPTMAETYRIAALDGLGKVHMNYPVGTANPNSNPSVTVNTSADASKLKQHLQASTLTSPSTPEIKSG